MTLYTIGYGGRSMDQFLDLLTSAGVATVVDVRLRPDKAHSGEWVRAKAADKGIERRLIERGIGYVALVELGNPFVGLDDWRPRYQRLIDCAGKLLTERLAGIPGPVCLLCAEKLPEDCHRSQIAEFLERAQAAQIVHLV